MFDRRGEHRGRTYLGGQVVFNNRWSTIDCLVRNMSERGAKLEFPRSVYLPDEFELTIRQRGSSRRARVVWREARSLGISFTDPAPAPAIPIELARQIRKLKAERDMLAQRVRDLSETSI